MAVPHPRRQRPAPAGTDLSHLNLVLTRFESFAARGSGTLERRSEEVRTRFEGSGPDATDGDDAGHLVCDADLGRFEPRVEQQRLPGGVARDRAPRGQIVLDEDATRAEQRLSIALKFILV